VFILPSLASHPQFPLTKLVQSLLLSDGSWAVSMTASMLYPVLAVSRSGMASILPVSEQTLLAALTKQQTRFMETALVIIGRILGKALYVG
jgi:hypothetical protein